MSRVSRRFGRIRRPASVFSRVSALVLSLAATAPAGADPSPAPPPEPPAMAGHDAEARMRTPEDEARWRRLFFDPAAREIGEPGVSCDHRRLRRPETIRGLGAVAIAFDRDDGRLRLRLWLPPTGDVVPDSTSVAADLRRRLADSGSTADVEVEVRLFAWCR